ncbi:MAG: hypothetical protein OEV42_04630 [Deltaproteobacteria bacterium]|nr:hypothetical protein [Deltaproteobacteria bacterium]
MGAATQTIVVDGCSYAVSFTGFHEPMEVSIKKGKSFTFLPWTYGDHLKALRQSIIPVAKGLELSRDRFCRLVLSRCCPDSDSSDGLAGLALWWAGGVETDETLSAESNRDGWLDLGPTRVRLKSWSNAERFQALSDCLIDDEGGESIDAVAYLDAMVRASIEKMEPPMDPGELDPAAAARLMTAAVNLNAPEQLLPQSVLDGDSKILSGHARATVKLCASLGWTPSRVWATPAAEVDRLIALIDLMEPEEPAQHPQSSGLSQYADAVVFHFEDD